MFEACLIKINDPASKAHIKSVIPTGNVFSDTISKSESNLSDGS